jgi:hypothetical protein
MFWALKQLAVPLRYLRIREGEGFFLSKRVYDYMLPAIATSLTGAVFGAAGLPISLSSAPALVDKVGSLVQLMSAFYLAALAAVSTFDRKGLDDPVKNAGSPVTLKMLDADTGKPVPRELTNRQFICYLFGYLSYMSLILFVISSIATVLLESNIDGALVHFMQKTDLGWALDAGLFAGFYFLTWQLVVTSLFGIYVLADRLQFLDDKSH